ncbi:MAG: hypothetical protein PV344_00550, partial [Anaplasma sp.]|nr:hypothetical protein [Anaplasma sp.]
GSSNGDVMRRPCLLGGIGRVGAPELSNLRRFDLIAGFKWFTTRFQYDALLEYDSLFTVSLLGM